MKWTNICFFILFYRQIGRRSSFFVLKKVGLDWVGQSEIEKKTLAKPKSLNFLKIENMIFLKIWIFLKMSIFAFRMEGLGQLQVVVVAFVFFVLGNSILVNLGTSEHLGYSKIDIMSLVLEKFIFQKN